MTPRPMFFAALLSLVTASAAAQGVSTVVDAAGTTLGLYAGQRNGVIVIHNPRGYRFGVHAVDGSLVTLEAGGGIGDVGGAGYDSRLYYSTFNCAGTPTVNVTPIGERSDGGAVTAVAGGVVIRISDGSLYAVEKGAAISLVAIGSIGDAGTCEPPPQGTPGYLVVPATPNDPDVTGVPNTPFVPPLRLEVVPLSVLRGEFSDGFESTSRLAAGGVDGVA